MLDLSDLQHLSRVYADLGGAVSSQLDSLIERHASSEAPIEELIDEGELNPNALSLMRPWLEAADGLGTDAAFEILELIENYEREAAEWRASYGEAQR